MTGAEQLIQKGRQQGIQEGMQQAAIQLGAKHLLEKLLVKKFGELTLVYKEKIEHASTDLLLMWGERFVEAKTIKEIFQDSH